MAEGAAGVVCGGTDEEQISDREVEKGHQGNPNGVVSTDKSLLTLLAPSVPGGAWAQASRGQAGAATLRPMRLSSLELAAFWPD